MPLDSSTPYGLHLPAARPSRILGLEAPEWGGFLVALGTVLCLAGTVSLVALRLLDG